MKVTEAQAPEGQLMSGRREVFEPCPDAKNARRVRFYNIAFATLIFLCAAGRGPLAQQTSGTPGSAEATTMTDDVGFGAPSTFGGVIPTPAFDRVAAMGLRYTNFHTTALCSPTCAALITGRNHRSVGFGVISEQATGFPGYKSILPKDTVTIGEHSPGKRLPHVVVWQGPQHSDVSSQPSWAI